MTNTNLFAKKLFLTKDDLTESFVDTKMELTSAELQTISDELECGKIIFSAILPTRKLSLVFSKDDFQVFPGEKLPEALSSDYEIHTSNYFVFFIQTTRGFFLMLASTFDLLGYASSRCMGNPFEEEDLMDEITGKIGKIMKIKTRSHYKGVEGSELNVFESNKGFRFFVFQI